MLQRVNYHGLLFQDIANYSVLKLTPAARPLLRGEQTVELAKPRIRKKAKAESKRKAPNNLPYDEVLFEKLRVLRKKIATELDVPPYIVFGDATLIHMAQLKPSNNHQMLEVNGVGQVKLERFGDAFLTCLNNLENKE